MFGATTTPATGESRGSDPPDRRSVRRQLGPSTRAPAAGDVLGDVAILVPALTSLPFLEDALSDVDALDAHEVLEDLR